MPFYKCSWRRLDIRTLAVATSLLISSYTILFPKLPNDDAFIYIRTAEIFLQQGLSAAFAQYSWASYSVLIGTVGYFSGLDLFVSAYLINAVLYAILVYSVVSIVKEIDDSKLILTLSCLFILSYPQLNEYRYFIIRDIGFWSFCIFGLWLSIKYLRTLKPKYVIGFCTALILASLFRLEAIIYLFVTLLMLIFVSGIEGQHPNYGVIRRLFLPATLILILLILFYILVSKSGLDPSSLAGNFISTYGPFLENLFFITERENIDLSIMVFGEHAAYYSQEYLPLFIFTGLMSILVAKIVSGIGVPYLVVILTGIVSKLVEFKKPAVLPLISYLLTGLIILIFFILLTRFLTTRYTMLFGIVFSLQVPFILKQLIINSGTKKKKNNIIALIVVLFLYCVIDAYHSFGDKKPFIKESLLWMEENMPPTFPLITNNRAIAYYSGQVENYDQISQIIDEGTIDNADINSILVIELNRDMEVFVNNGKLAEYEFLIGFFDDRKQRLSIYRKTDR